MLTFSGVPKFPLINHDTSVVEVSQQGQYFLSIQNTNLDKRITIIGLFLWFLWLTLTFAAFKAPTAKNYPWPIISITRTSLQISKKLIYFIEAKISSGLSWNSPHILLCRLFLFHVFDKLQWDNCNCSAKGVLRVKIKASTFHALRTDIDCLRVPWKNFHVLWAVLCYLSDCTL